MHSSRYAILVILLIFAGLPQWLSAQSPVPGELDTTFSTDGKAIATLAGYNSSATALDVQPDGSVLVAGQAWSGGTNYRMVMARFEPDGDLDLSFGTQGFVTFGPSAGQTYAARSIKVLSTGKILVAVDYGNTSLLLRFLSNGQLDSGFANSTRNFSNAVTVSAMAVQEDGRILIGSKIGTANYVSRYSASGVFEADWSAGSYLTIRCLAIQPDGKILFGGSATQYSLRSYIGRLLPGLTTDYDFSRSIFTSSQGTASVEAMALDAEGNVVALATHPGNVNDVAVYRLLPNSNPDTSFDGDGVVETTLGGSGSAPKSLAIQPDGRILIFGHQPHGASNSRLGLRRFEWAGALDSSFGSNGLLTVSLGTTSTDSAGMLLVPGGKVVAAGGALESGFLRGLGVARLHTGNYLALPVITITNEPQGGTYALGDAATLSVTTEVIPDVPVSYAWYRNGSLVANETGPELRIASLTAANEGDYQVRMRAGNGRVSSQSVRLTVLQPPVLGGRPGPQTYVNIGGGPSFYVSAQGRSPFTFRLLKGDEVVQTAQASGSHGSVYFGFSGVKPSDAGEYFVEVTNQDGVVKSPWTELVVVPDPTLVAAPPALVSLGSSFSLVPTLITSLVPRFRWTKDGKVLGGETLEVLSKDSAQLSDAGEYRARVVTLKGSSETQPMPLCVVDPGERRHIAGKGKEFKLSIPVAGRGLSFKWMKGTTPILAREGLTGLDQATLRFSSIELTDAGDYNCLVTLGETELLCGAQAVLVAETVPAAPSIELGEAYVGMPYEVAFEVPELASSIKVTGLPPGLTYSAASKKIGGIPRLAGEFALTCTAANPLGESASVGMTLKVNALAGWASGRFQAITEMPTYGYLSPTPQPAILVTLHVGDSGAYSGTVTCSVHGGRTAQASFRGALDSGVPGEKGVPASLSSAVDLPFKGLWTVRGKARLQFTVSPLVIPGQDAIAGTFTVPVTLPDLGNTEVVFFFRGNDCPWSSKQPVDPAVRGTFHFAIGQYEAPSPAGYGFARGTVSSSGTLAMKGRLGDGAVFTSSCPIGESLRAVGIQFLYSGRGALSYALYLSPGTSAPDYFDAYIHGQMLWEKQGSGYRSGQGYPFTFVTRGTLSGGGKYLKPNHASGLTGPLMLNVEEAAPNGTNLQVSAFGSNNTGNLGASHAVKFSGIETNPMGFSTLKFNPATGDFSGSGVTLITEDFADEEGSPYQVISKRPFKVQGLVIREPTQLNSTGVGFTLVPQEFDDPSTDKWDGYRMNVSEPISVGPVTY